MQNFSGSIETVLPSVPWSLLRYHSRSLYPTGIQLCLPTQSTWTSPQHQQTLSLKSHMSIYRSHTEPTPMIWTIILIRFFLSLNIIKKKNKICQLLRLNWPILGTSDITSDLYQSKLTCGARRTPRRHDILVHSSIPLKPAFGKKGKSTNVCHTAHCKYCANIDR